jgi:hypothetical protein
MLVWPDEDAPAWALGDRCVRATLRTPERHDRDFIVLDVVRRDAELRLIAGYTGERKCHHGRSSRSVRAANVLLGNIRVGELADRALDDSGGMKLLEHGFDLWLCIALGLKMLDKLRAPDLSLSIEVPRAIFLSAHKAAQKNTAGSPIISDLTGKRRVQYKTEKTLSAELHKLCREHDYTRRFEKALTTILKKKSKGAKKSGRALALKVVRALAKTA